MEKNNPLMISDVDFEKFFSYHVKLIEKNWNEKSMPMLFIFAHNTQSNENEDICMMLDPMAMAPETKHEVLRQVGQTLFERGLFPIAVLLVTEAWMSFHSNIDQLRGISLPPSKDPKRIEKLIIIALTIDNRTMVSASSIFRADHEVKLSQFERWTGGVECDLLKHFFAGCAASFNSKRQHYSESEPNAN